MFGRTSASWRIYVISHYIIYCTKKYISQANARLGLWTPLPCNFPFTLLHGQLGQGNSWYARLDRTGWSSDAPLWIYSFGSETQQHVTMSHVNCLYSNSNPWIPQKKWRTFPSESKLPYNFKYFKRLHKPFCFETKNQPWSFFVTLKKRVALLPPPGWDLHHLRREW